MNSTRDSTTRHSFLLALSTAYRLSGDSQIRVEIGFITHIPGYVSLRSPHGGFIEGIPTTLPRRQNPQMHLFETMIATFDATGDPVFQNRAGELYNLFVANLYDPQRQVLGEFFEEDWSKIEPVSVEPGHQAEWVWLLKCFERITGCPTARYRAELLASALRYRDNSDGLPVRRRRRKRNITKLTRRCWPQTEIAKAWIAQAEADEPGAARTRHKALVRMYRHYLCHPVQGGWYDQFDNDNLSLSGYDSSLFILPYTLRGCRSRSCSRLVRRLPILRIWDGFFGTWQCTAVAVLWT